MDRTLRIVTSALLLAGCAPRTIPIQVQNTWFECKTDRECTILEDPRCTLVPINRRYADSFAAWVRLYRPDDVRSSPCAGNALQYESICDESRRCSSSVIRPNAAGSTRVQSESTGSSRGRLSEYK